MWPVRFEFSLLQAGVYQDYDVSSLHLKGMSYYWFHLNHIIDILLLTDAYVGKSVSFIIRITKK